jgi:hypothetical protein
MVCEHRDVLEGYGIPVLVSMVAFSEMVHVPPSSAGPGVTQTPGLMADQRARMRSTFA